MIIIVLHLLAEAKDIEGLVSEHHVLLVVDGGHGQLALGDVPVVEDVVGQQTLWREIFFYHNSKKFLQRFPYLVSSSYLGLEVRNLVGHHVVEGVVAPLKRLLVGETGLLKEVYHHVRSRQLSGGVEMNPAKCLQLFKATTDHHDQKTKIIPYGPSSSRPPEVEY